MKKGAIFSQEHKDKLRAAKFKNPTRYWKGKKFSKRHKKKLSLAKEGFAPWNNGIPMTKCTKNKLSKSIIALYIAKPEIKKKISKSIKKLWKNPIYWKKCSEAQRGEKARLWKGGISREPYSFDFSKELKERIKQRDNLICRKCGKGGRLAVHHIDYNKKNSSELNLVSLCISCHAKTNQNREQWTQFFKQILAAAETK